MPRTTSARHTTLPTTHPAISPALSVVEEVVATVDVAATAVVEDDACTTDGALEDAVGAGDERVVTERVVVVVNTVAVCDGG